jgi:hypothetical protein
MRFLAIFFLLLISAAESRAAVAFGGSCGSYTNDANNGAWTFTIQTNGIPVGARAVAYLGLESNSGQIFSSVSDSKGNTWTLHLQQLNNSVHQCAIATAPITSALVAGTDTITVTYSSSAFTTRAAQVVWFTGVLSAAADVTIKATWNAQTVADSITTTVAGDLIVGQVQAQRSDSVGTPPSDPYVYSSGSYTATPAGLFDYGYSGSTVGLRTYPFYRITTTAGAYAFGGAWNKTASYIGMAVALLPATTRDRYIDFAAGSDGNAGTSTGAPWKHCPGDTNATSNASSFVAQAGDTFWFKGGVAYTGCVQPRVSGTLGLPIIYDGTGATWGTGKAQMDLAATYYSAFQVKPARDYITINGFDIYNAKNCNGAQNQSVNRNGVDTTGINYLGNNDTVDQGGVIYFSGACKGPIVINCRIHELENCYDRGILNAESFGDTATIPIAVPCQKSAIKFYSGPVDGIISNNVIWAVGRTAIWLTGVSNILSCNNNIGGDSSVTATNRGWFAVAYLLSGAGSLGCENSILQDDLVHDGWQYGGDEAQQRSHAGDWFHMFGDNDGVLEAHADVHDVLIQREFLYSDHTFAYENGTSYVFIESDVYSIEFRNCLMVNSFSGSIEMRDCSNVVCNANSFIDNNGKQPMSLKVGTFFAGPKATKFRNNIFYTTSANSAGPPMGSTDGTYTGDIPDSDYNAYYSPNNGNNSVRWSGINYSLAAWRTFSGQDAHSIYGTPGLISVPANGSTSSSGDYRPNSSTPSALIGAGLDQSSTFTVYRDGTTRSGTWLIGSEPAAAGGGSGVVASAMAGGVRSVGGVRMQ